MNKLFSIATLAFALLTAAPSAHGAIIITTDLGAGPGVSRTFVPGEVVSANIFMELTTPSDLSSYNFSVRFDQSELTYQTRDENDFGALNLELATADSTSGNLVLNIDRATLSAAGQGAPFGPVNVATLNFLFNPTAGSDLPVDIEAGLFSTGNDFFFSANGSDVGGQVDFSGSAVSVSAVPEPGSMAALAAVGAGGWYTRRRRKPRA